jgi:hypothetical protein
LGPPPLSLTDLSLFTAILAVILSLTSELLSPYYGSTGIVMDRKRFRNVALLVAMIFISSVALRIGQILMGT